MSYYLVEYVASLQPSLRIHNGTLKYLLKQAAKDLLPASILSRPKQGFGVPIKHWFRGDLLSYAHEVLESAQARQRGIFQPQFIHDVLTGHAKTRLVDYSSAIWTLLCLEVWFRIYIDEPSLQVEQAAQLQTTPCVGA
jgi:asparagine synthase (glutamine-hydrolysing)